MTCARKRFIVLIKYVRCVIVSNIFSNQMRKDKKEPKRNILLVSRAAV